MLDSDVAMLYQYTTKNINKAVKRNIDRFPEDFCFQLTESEFWELRFRFGTLNRKANNGNVTRKCLPYVFTEQGISMFSGILRNEIAKTNKFHDRFIIIDDKEMYHLGASIKDLGKKCFGINKIEDEEYLEIIIKNIGEDKCTN